MTDTLRALLTTKNPKLDSDKLKKGSTTKLPGSPVGPHKTEEWTGFSLANINHNFGDILSQSMSAQKLSLPDWNPRWEKLGEEDCIKFKVHDKWNVPIVMKALNTATDLPSAERREKDFVLEHITAYTDVEEMLPNVRELKIRIKPDWWCWQSCNGTKTLLTFGETKPSLKFRSSWINSPIIEEKIKAVQSLAQVTRYSMLGKLAHGFIMTDIEFFAFRLSRRPRTNSHSNVRSSERTDIQPGGRLGLKAMRGRPNQSQANQLSRNESFMNSMQVDLTYTMPATRVSQTQEVSHLLPQFLDGTYADDTSRTIDVVLEWTAIPWTTHGTGELTFNLGTWALVMLASEQQLMDGHELEEPGEPPESQDSSSTMRSQDTSHDSQSMDAISQTPSRSFGQMSTLHAQESVGKVFNRTRRARTLRPRTPVMSDVSARSSFSYKRSKSSEQPLTPGSVNRSRVSKPSAGPSGTKTFLKQRNTRSKIRV